MTDRELLELAAKAAGELTPSWYGNDAYFDGVLSRWNPLDDDGDALRLAVNLGISLLPYPVYAESDRHSVMAKQRRRTDTMRVQNPTEVIELYGDDPYAATRRAIVRVAAEIGKEME
jgi:hypothetical protein